MADLIRVRVEVLRRLATELVSALGTTPPRAAALATQLLWFDAAGASSFGIATLPRWLERIEGGEFNLPAEGKVTLERNGTAVIDGQGGLPPLILERAAAVAVEKARDAGLGLVRVSRVGATGSTAVLAAEIAIGPMWALVAGPGPSWSLALPSEEGLPVVYDSAIDGAGMGRQAPTAWPRWLAPWSAVLVPEGGWLIATVATAAWESLGAFHERVKAAIRVLEADPGPGQLLPADCEARRREVREHGVPVTDAVRKELSTWADRLGVEPLSPGTP